ncbi:hypothetical protein BDW22DRAFT_1346799 [Trametopsis cervina]|nr:hypothetical protein BDW22DRAFT_1346799 [Trametopsis cervina]
MESMFLDTRYYEGERSRAVPAEESGTGAPPSGELSVHPDDTDSPCDMHRRMHHYVATHRETEGHLRARQCCTRIRLVRMFGLFAHSVVMARSEWDAPVDAVQRPPFVMPGLQVEERNMTWPGWVRDSRSSQSPQLQIDEVAVQTNICLSWKKGLAVIVPSPKSTRPCTIRTMNALL